MQFSAILSAYGVILSIMALQFPNGLMNHGTNLSQGCAHTSLYVWCLSWMAISCLSLCKELQWPHYVALSILNEGMAVHQPKGLFHLVND